jgi:tripartite-type tricarboxylate transporter receptor subunit TctC
MPDLPTVAESGVPGFEAGSWYGLLAPAATPRSIVERLNREVVRDRFASEGFDVPADTPEQFAAYIRATSRSGRKSCK